MSRVGQALVLVFATVLVLASAQEKRQFFDSLGGMALGKRAHAASGVYELLADPEIRQGVYRLMKRSREAQKRERIVMDALGGDYLMKRSA
uniref:Uncharacterized protein n=1 Tax=Plectus sambesii TaxID=2011161 RepID=A0A914X8L5_9BILA